MAKRKRSSEIRLHPRTLSKHERDAIEVENTKRLDKLPKEVWEKILGHLGENDLFPLALSCRYFRQKQKELVARARQNGKPGLALKTTFLTRNPVKGQPASAEYLQFCSKENISRIRSRDLFIRNLAAFHGHLPLLRELQAGSTWIDHEITRVAGEYPLSQSPLLVCFGF